MLLYGVVVITVSRCHHEEGWCAGESYLLPPAEWSRKMSGGDGDGGGGGGGDGGGDHAPPNQHSVGPTLSAGLPDTDVHVATTTPKFNQHFRRIPESAGPSVPRPAARLSPLRTALKHLSATSLP